MANIKNRKKIATDSNCLRCHGFTHSTWLSNGNYLFFSKQDRKERYWGQQLWQMERHISVRPTEMTRPVTVDHLQSWSRIFRSDQTEMVRSIWWTNRNFRNFGLNGKRPFVVKMSFICIIIKTHFHINGFALSLALKVRFFGTRKWPILKKQEMLTPLHGYVIGQGYKRKML